MTIDWAEDAPGIWRAQAPNAAEFLQALRRSHPQWWEGDRMPWVFRGHAHDWWLLLPSAWRGQNAIISAARHEAANRYKAVGPKPELKWMFGNFVTGAFAFGPNDAALSEQLAIEATAELLPVWDFCLACNEAGLEMPLEQTPPDPAVHPNWLHSPALPLVADEYARYSDIPLALALAQHHAIPTRLLDWTLNPIAAAFFAIEALPNPLPDSSIVVWALHRQRATSIKAPGVTFPNAVNFPNVEPGIQIIRPSIRDNPYLAAQSGLFTALHSSGVFFMQHNGQRPSMEAFLAASQTKDVVLRKLVLSHDHVPDLTEMLRREQVYRSALMPTLDNVALDVRRHWSSRHAVGPFVSS